MHAAVVTSFDAPPQYASFEEPVASGPDELVVDVLAAGLHQRVRSAADGTHYESDGQLPLIPGFDGVGRDADGALRYFILPDTRLGSMAERVAIDARRSVVLPGGVDPVVLAAAMNPAMSAWLALRRRIDFTPGSNVMVLGATGNAGRMAVQIARHLGAASVVAAARPSARLDALLALGADRVVALDDVGPAAGDADVVLDYLWGTATAAALPAVLTARPDRGRPLTWIQIGSMAGLDLTVPSAWLRAARLALVGSGQGSVPTRDIVAELPALAAHLTTNAHTIDATPTPLAEVATAWTAPRSTNRIVFTP
jgi:NADPH:quinone reductase-like Zn-dependent oxidoreductase